MTAGSLSFFVERTLGIFNLGVNVRRKTSRSYSCAPLARSMEHMGVAFAEYLCARFFRHFIVFASHKVETSFVCVRMSQKWQARQRKEKTLKWNCFANTFLLFMKAKERLRPENKITETGCLAFLRHLFSFYFRNFGGRFVMTLRQMNLVSTRKRTHGGVPHLRTCALYRCIFKTVLKLVERQFEWIKFASCVNPSAMWSQPNWKSRRKLFSVASVKRSSRTSRAAATNDSSMSYKVHVELIPLKNPWHETRGLIWRAHASLFSSWSFS